MKKLLLLFTIVFILFSGETKAQSKDVRAVTQAVEALRKAMIDADTVVLHALVRNELSYGHSSGRVEGKASLISSLKSGASDFVTIDLTEQTVQVTDETAIVRHVLSANTNDAGNPGTVKLSVLTVWVKDKRKWKLLARQAVRM